MPMTDPAHINKVLAEEFMELVPCGDWEPAALGPAGFVLWKKCSHPVGKCYSIRSVGSVNGLVGGVPNYCGDLVAANAVWNRLIEVSARKGIWQWNFLKEIVVNLKDGETSLLSAKGTTMAEAICAAALEWMAKGSKQEVAIAHTPVRSS